ncbi:MAG: antirestriction protein [Smithellaceae bacterium]
MNNKVTEVLENILTRFKSGDIPQAIALTRFPIPDIPSAKWSFTNRLIMCLAGTTDTRGIRQWNSVGRKVRKGTKAIYILVPRIATLTDSNNENEERVIVKGFLAQPVFRMEDTEGEPLDYEEKICLPDLPLLNIAKDWNIAVSAVAPFSQAFGSHRSTTKEILLATPEELVFFHELSHAAHERVIEKLQPGQNWDQEIIAELCAQVLCHLVGKQPINSLGNSYIEGYAKNAGLTPISACLKVIDDVQKVLSLILDWQPENPLTSDISLTEQRAEVA